MLRLASGPLLEKLGLGSLARGFSFVKPGGRAVKVFPRRSFSSWLTSGGQHHPSAPGHLLFGGRNPNLMLKVLRTGLARPHVSRGFAHDRGIPENPFLCY